MKIVMRDHEVRGLRRAKVTIRPLDPNRSNVGTDPGSSQYGARGIMMESDEKMENIH
jgi:hypothetical protein